MELAYFLKCFAALFAIMSPIANLPVFISLTEGRTASQQRQIALTCGLGVAVGGAVAILGGKPLLSLFGLDIDDFRMAGGLLILLIALSMVNGKTSDSHHGSSDEKAAYSRDDNPAVYPLTVPILMGPGTISTLIIFENQAKGVAGEMGLWLALLTMVALLTATFIAAERLTKLLGASATSVMSRIMGMILAAIAVEMMVASAKSMFLIHGA